MIPSTNVINGCIQPLIGNILFCILLFFRRFFFLLLYWVY
uniref:Uncharacterized protein n=1 Tax=Myoviridae sp. ct3pM2 TaxID=2827658 RepID=A0A8S5TEH2_9CAUD|nr:MAG TPA: hypothetical protein [Myoviridae sp. ct3pM2]